MNNPDRSQRALRLSAALLLLLFVVPAYPSDHHSEAWARTQFTTAERMREAMNGRPAGERTRREYQRVVNAYRQVYYGAPASSKADPSVVAVAELLVEMGRRFDDDRTLRSAVGQYEFLRREYPGSKYRFQALFTIGEIYKDDLDDPQRARAVFEEFTRRYPRNHLADEARAALEEPVEQAALRSKEAPDKEKDEDSRDESSRVRENRSSAKEREGTVKPARVTGIRHWSTPDYTRVAIDLEQDVKFESQRIDRPDRIVFDLADTRLASTLVGKSFDVDDGFLKKIRVAQFQPGKTRVVLEVDNLADYNAFLLPNPSRLIIDVHGKDVHGKDIHSNDIHGKREDNTAAGNAPPGPVEVSSRNLPPIQAKAGTKDLEKPGSSKAQPQPDRRGGAQAESVKSGPEQSLAKNPASKKTVVEEDDDDDVTVTKLDPAEIKPASIAMAAPVIPSDQPAAAGGSASPAPGVQTSKKTGRGRSTRAKRQGAAEVDGRAARPTASGDRSLIRALGLKIGKIVIDPGHGGHDTGTIGSNGLEEKDLVLEVGKRLGKLLETKMGAEVVYTRDDDTFIPLETRTAIANRERADLFVSIHANSSRDPDARGVETYYLNFTSSPDALDVAARENAVSEKSIYELQDLVKKIALRDKIDESREFATDVQRSLHSGLAAKSPGMRDRGVRKAPFIVLIGANMPSILAEISFVSNPGDERRLETSEYRQRIAESLYRGIAKYVSGLSGVKVASKIEKGEGQ